MKPHKNEYFYKIRALLETGNEVDINLAYQLSNGVDFNIDEVLEEDYKELYEIFSIAENTSIKK
ncbi:MAG: hypothetical protein MK212_18980, partial [Saprospiraceae bacterium]|nr:hypothetical protein [Saprospiraceae bacterium]